MCARLLIQYGAGNCKKSIVTLISFYLFNGNYVTVVVRKVDTLVKWRRSLLEESPAISLKLGALVEEHIYTIMETIQEHITVERERLKQGSLD